MKALTAIFGFIVGAAVAYAICLGLYIAFTVIADYSDREGATGMMVAFFIAPVAAVIGGIAAAIWAVRRRSAKQSGKA